MFRIIKLLNARTNVPETVAIPVTASTVYPEGCAVKLSSGAAVHCAATDAPEYIVAAAADASVDSVVLCYPLLGDAIVETPVSAAPTSLKIGNKVTLNVNASSVAVGVTATTTNGVAEIYDLAGAAAAGDKLLLIM